MTGAAQYTDDVKEFAPIAEEAEILRFDHIRRLLRTWYGFHAEDVVRQVSNALTCATILGRLHLREDFIKLG